MKNQRIVFLLAYFISFAFSVKGQNDLPNIEPASHIGGVVEAAAFGDEYGYLSQGGYLTIMDLTTDPFTQIAYQDIKGKPADMEIRDGYLYMIGSDLLIYDLNNPMQPLLIGELAFGTTTDPQFFLAGNNLYSATYDEGLRIIDISVPSDPQLITHYSDGSDYGDVAVAGDYAYVLDNNFSTLNILNVSDPGNPVETGRVNVQTGPNSLFVKNDIAYITVFSFPDIGMRIFDVADKENPVELGYIETKTVDGNVTHYDTPGKVIVENDLAFVGCSTENSVYVFDVTDPSTPQEFSRLFISAGWEGGLAAMEKMGSNLYLCYSWSGNPVRQIDASDPTTMQLVNKFESPFDVLWLQNGPDYLYLADQSRLWIYDLADAYQPTLVASYEDWKFVNRCILQENLFIASRNDTLFILDVSNPMIIEQLAIIALTDWPGELLIENGYLFVLLDKNPGTVEVYDMADPVNPVQLSSFDLSGIGHGIFYDNTSKLLVAGTYKNPGEYGFDLYDLTDISNPTFVKTVQTASVPTAVAIDGDFVYFAGDRDNAGTTQWHIEAYDITDPFNPFLVSQLASDGEVWDMEVVEGIIFAGVPGNTIYLIGWINDILSIFEECPSETTREISVSTPNMTSYTSTGASVDGDGKKYPSGRKDLSGTDGVPIQIITWPTPQQCCLRTVVRPEIAATPSEPYECSSTPQCVSGTCGTGSVVKGSPGPEWVFTHWSGAATGNSPTTNASISGMTGCPQCPDNIAYAHFTPWMDITGGGTVIECPFEEEDENIAMTFNLKASKADSWTINSIDVKISGDEDLSQYIKKAKLEWTGEDEKDHTGNGTVTFNTSGLILEPGKSQQFILYLTCNPMTDIKCPTEPKSLTIEVESGGINANAVTYSPGKVRNTSNGTFTVGCVNNITQGEVYEKIKEAVEDANENDEIWVCPGDYEENVEIDKEQLKLYAPKGPTETYILAEQNDKPCVQVKTNGVTIEGFGCRNATQSYGIYVYGSTIENCMLKNNRLAKNKHGIYLRDTKKIYIDHCSGLENEESGLYAVNAVETTVNKSSFYDNKQHGMYFEDCPGSQETITSINESACQENDENGVFLKNSKYINIDYNTSFSKNDSCGIEIDNCESIIVRDNSFINENNLGVRIKNSKKIALQSNQVNENKDKGIMVLDCMPANTVEANHINKNVIVGNRLSSRQNYGIYIKNSMYTQVGKSAEINEIRSHKLNGITIIGGSKNKLEGDSIFWNDQYGIHLKNTCDNLISGKIKLGPENQIGLLIEDCLCANDKANIIQKARIMDNKNNGVYLTKSRGVTIGTEEMGNTLSRNKENGIELDECIGTSYDNIKITGNKIYENDKYGIKVQASDLHLISKNEIWSNKSDGILIRRESTSNELNENTIDGKKIQEYGVIISYSDGNELDNNTITNHKASGVWINETEGAYLTNNTFEKNTIGIHCESAKSISIGKYDEQKGPNTFKDNTNSGIYLENVDGKANTFVSNNEFIRETIGLLVEKSKDLTIDNNTFREKNETAIKIKDAETNLDKALKVENNIITGCLSHGIILEKCQGVIIGGDVISKSNQIKSNKGNGIMLKDCKPPYDPGGFINRIVKNSVYDKNNNGIYLTNSQYTDIRENSVLDNKKDGIRLSTGALWNTVEKNSCRENKASGIALKQAEQNYINGNELLRNGESGIFLTKSNYNEIPQHNKGQNLIHENEDHGIRLDDSYKNYVRAADIKRNKKHGIVINKGGQNHVTGPAEIMDNTKDGIQLNQTSFNRIWNRTTGNKKKINYKMMIKSNGSQGIHLKKSHNNVFSSIRIWKHTTGLLLEHSNNNRFDIDVRILLNWLGGHGICSYSSTYGLCMYHNNVVTTQMDGCSVVPSLFEGCHFISSEENAFTLTNGGKPTFRNCNFIDVGNWAIENNNDTVTIDARHNWWGHESGPGGMGPGQGVKVGENVIFEPWLTAPISLQAVFDQDTLYLQNNKPDSIYHFITNELNPLDTVQVTIQDSLDWEGLMLNYEAGLIDSFGFDSIQLFTYDPAIHEGEINKLVMDCTSLVNPDQSARDSIYLVTYEPRLDRILLFPDSLELTLGESWHFRPILLDQHGNDIQVALNWWSDAEQLDEEGLFTGTESGAWNIWVSDTAETDTAWVRVYVNDLPVLNQISVIPEEAELNQGDTLRFDADGWDQFGNPYYFRPVWDADGGRIDSVGLYLADDEPGNYTITAYNPDSTVWGTAAVMIILVNTEDINEQADPFIVHKAYPNPFLDQTTLSFQLAIQAPVSIRIYDETGNKYFEIREKNYIPGKYEIRLNGERFKPGTYFYNIRFGTKKWTGKLIKL